MSEAVIRDELLPLAEALPASPMESIQQNFQHVETKWGAKALLAVNSLEALKALLEEVAAADRADGFRRIIADGDERDALFYVQLNTTNEREFRPYRIVRSSEGEFLLYGHPKLYEVTGEGENDALKAMIEELIVIGREEGTYLDISPRVTVLGTALHESGGVGMMREAIRAVRAELGPVRARQLEVAWNGIGEWQH